MDLDRFSQPLWDEKTSNRLEADALDAYKQQLEDHMIDSLEGGETGDEQGRTRKKV